MNETPLLTQEMVADAGRHALQFEAEAEEAREERDHQEKVRAAFAERAAQARFIRDYMRPRIGRSLASIQEEARAQLEQAEAAAAVASARVHELLERQRDLLGYKRIMEELAQKPEHAEEATP